MYATSYSILPTVSIELLILMLVRYGRSDVSKIFMLSVEINLVYFKLRLLHIALLYIFQIFV
jgi:hypothetical protein